MAQYRLHFQMHMAFNEAWMAAFNGVGFSDHSDPILGRKLGAFTPPNSIDPKENKRSNLDLLTETYATKILLKSLAGFVTANGV
jgi:hypothetical protein